MKRRAKADPVTAETRQFVLLRDGCCTAFRFDVTHACYDNWGNPHSPYDLDRLSLEHVKDQPRMGRRAPSDPAHLVALCHAANVGVPSKVQREFFRRYLEAVA